MERYQPTRPPISCWSETRNEGRVVSLVVGLKNSDKNSSLGSNRLRAGDFQESVTRQKAAAVFDTAWSAQEQLGGDYVTSGR